MSGAESEAIPGLGGPGPAVAGADPVSAAQTRAAHAYAEVLLPAEDAPPAARDALAAFRHAIVATPPGTPVSNETLLALTRLMVAVSLPDGSAPADRRQAVWASIGASSRCTCREAAALLATRANRSIQPRESAALDAHLADCAGCRELSAATAVAEAAFHRALSPPHAGGLGGIPRTTSFVALLLASLGIGGAALLGGTHHTVRPAASALTHSTPAPALARAFETTATGSTTGATARSRHHHPPARHHPVRVTPDSARAPAQVAPAESGAATGPAAAGPAAVRETPQPSPTAAAAPVASAPATTPRTAPTTTTPAVTTASGTSTHTTTAASTVTAPTSLPAETVTQQGIGSLTGTTPP